MQKFTLVFCLIFSASTLVFLQPKNALAYLDPGTGSYFLQIVIAGLVGAIVSIKIFWVRIKAFFGNLFGKKE